MPLGDIITAGGRAVQDLFASEGATAEANSYNSAAQLADQNAQLTKTSTKIQQTQLAQKIYQTEGTQIADIAGAGFTESGSALDLLRSSAQQGSLAKSLVNIQGAINENSYAQQAGAYRGAAKAAGENAKANTVGAIASIGGAILSNTGTLLSAGKTVVSGIDYVANALFGSAPEIGSAFSGASAASGAANAASFLNPEGGVNFASSFLDNSIGGGSDLSSFFAASDIGLDTSALSIGTDASAVFEGIGSVFSSITEGVSSALSDVASYFGLDELAGLSLGPVGLLLPILSFIPGVSDVMNSITGAVGDVIGSVADGIGSIFGSVICTAYYRRNYIPLKVWRANQLYGARCNRTIFKGYHIWAKPVARAIEHNKSVARLLFPVFRPAIYEMAATMGVGRSTIAGRIALPIFLGVSWLVGFITNNGKENPHAVKARA